MLETRDVGACQILIPLNDQPAENNVAQYSASSKCNWDIICIDVCCTS